MYFEETKKLNELFKIAVVVVLIAGIIGGIVCGMALREPTADALDAIEKMADHPTLIDDFPEWQEKATELGWTGAGVGVMLCTWAMSAVGALLLCAKKRQIIMLDMIAGSIKGMPELETVEQETAAE